MCQTIIAFVSSNAPGIARPWHDGFIALDLISDSQDFLGPMMVAGNAGFHTVYLSVLTVPGRLRDNL